MGERYDSGSVPGQIASDYFFTSLGLTLVDDNLFDTTLQMPNDYQQHSIQTTQRYITIIRFTTRVVKKCMTQGKIARCKTPRYVQGSAALEAATLAFG